MRQTLLTALCVVLTASCGGPAAPAAPAPATPLVVSRPPAEPTGSCLPADGAPPLDDEALAHAVVKKICFVGNVRTRTAQFRAVLQSQEDKPLDRALVAGDLKRIFAMPGLDDVQVLVSSGAGGVVLSFLVRESALVKRVRFEGAAALDQAALEKLLDLPTGAPLDRARLAKGRERALAEYAHRGYSYATLATSFDPLPGGVVEVVVAIVEGPRVVVGSIVVPGARAIREAEITKLMTLQVGAAYSPLRLEHDTLLVLAAYYDRGMLDARVSPPELTPSADKRSMAIRMPVEEGVVYKVRSTKLSGDVAGREQAYLALLGVKVGDVISRTKVNAALAALRALRTKEGRSDRVEPEINRDPQNAVVDLVVHIGGS